MKIYREDTLLRYKYYKSYYKSNTVLGEIKKKIYKKNIIYNKYNICIYNVVNFMYVLCFLSMVFISKNIFGYIVSFTILFCLKLMYSHISFSKIRENNIVVGKMQYVMFSNTINIILNNISYEIYSHGGNLFSVTENNTQIALIKASDKIIANEFSFSIDCQDSYCNLVILFVMCIDDKFYGHKLGVRRNLIYNLVNTHNICDEHKERLLWKSEKDNKT